MMSSHVGEDKTKGPRGVRKCLILKPGKSLFNKTCIYQAVQSACRHAPKASSIATVHPAQILVFPYLQGSKLSRAEFLRWFVWLSCQRSFPWKLFGIENVFYTPSHRTHSKNGVMKVCNQHKLGVKQYIRGHELYSCMHWFSQNVVCYIQLANKSKTSTAIWQQRVVLNTAKLLLVVEEIKHPIYICICPV